MPVCTLTTSIACCKLPANLVTDLAAKVATVLGKPIERVSVMVHPDTLMFRNGSTAPSAIFTIWTIAVFNAEKNPAIADALREFVASKLELSGDRIGVILHDLKPEQLGMPSTK